MLPLRRRDDDVRPAVEQTPSSSAAVSSLTPGFSPDDVDIISTLDMAPGQYHAEPTAPSGVVFPDSGGVSVDIFMQPVEEDPTPADHWLNLTDENILFERPSTPADDVVVKGYEDMAPFCADINPWRQYDPNSTLYYLVNRVKGFAQDMASRSATPFLHRHLYQHHTPDSILSCFATCVLYTNRTPANTPMVMRSIQENASELVRTEATRLIAMSPEKLARAQALLLYQIIRLLDGDVALRAQAERDAPVLVAWLGDLCKIRDNLGTVSRMDEDAMTSEPPKEWESWIFAECVRRTIVIAYAVIALYDMLKNAGCGESGGLDPWAYMHRWTLSRSLWTANGVLEFQRAWKKSRSFIIANFSFQEFFEHGAAEDVDEFAEVLLTV
ncbi:hypothetical protein OQA88_5990 [Cercophora sp. LCS_1]